MVDAEIVGARAVMMLAPVTTRACRQCSKPFTPWSTTQAVCSRRCATTEQTAKRKADAARERAEYKARKEAIKPRSWWLAKCQAIVNRYVRLLALSRGEGCYTCGATPSLKFGGTYDAGHFRSVGSAPHLRFWMPQIKLQCIPCNRHNGGMALMFRRALVRDHGQEWVDRLEAMQHTAKFDIPYLKRFKAVMGKKLRRLERRRPVGASGHE